LAGKYLVTDKELKGTETVNAVLNIYLHAPDVDVWLRYSIEGLEYLSPTLLQIITLIENVVANRE